MSIILNIDTSIETASVSISENGIVSAYLQNTIQKDHASFLHIAVKYLLFELSYDIKEIDAIAVINGPGSYTGLRVGMASAKGLCFALNKPFITIGTLNCLATAAIRTIKNTIPGSILYCPMIDARRLEVFTSIFDRKMTEILPSCAMILHEKTFEDILNNNYIYFFGNGSLKWNKIIKSQNAGFIRELNTTEAFSKLSFEKFLTNDFSNLTYSEPKYIKDFFSPF